MTTPAAGTKFEIWIKRYTVAKLVEQLCNRGAETRVSFGVVYAWIRGEHEPRPVKRRVILQLAAGDVTHADIDAHFEAKKRK
jgi:hypothetical protein